MSDGTHNFVDTSWTIANLAGDAVSVSCGSCHTGGVTPGSASGAHTGHGVDAADLVAGGAACVDCHGNNGGLNFQSSLAGTHGTGSVNFANVTYSQAAARGNLTGTCLTANCHNRNTGTLQSTQWNTTQLDCDDCHFYSATPTSALNNANPRPLSTSHNDHFDNAKTCQQCHGTDPVAGDTAHISVVTTLADKATALQDEANIVWTHASAVTDYTFGTDNTCYSATNNGLGCHATGGAAGAADATRPDWDVAFASTACTNCHTNNTTAAVNPTSGLHGVVPSITGQAHDETMPGGGCSACHNPPAATHQNGTFSGNGSVAGDRTNMGLGAFYTTSGADNAGTCASTGTGCHGSATASQNYRDDWAHKWNSTANYYTTNTTSCGGCHGDWAQGWNTGVIHRTTVATQSTHGGTGTWDCKDCHALEATAPTYPFTFATADWAPLNAGVVHGDSIVQVNTNGTNYREHGAANPTTRRAGCARVPHDQDGTHNFVDTSWTIANLAGDAVSVSCGSCHTGGVQPGSASGAHTIHNAGSAALVAPGTPCQECHGTNGGLGFQSSLAGTHGNSSVNFAGVTYSTAVRNNVTGTCLTANCHNRSTGTLQSTQWNTTQLDCDDCHFYSATPTSALNNANPRPLSTAHNDHFDNGKTCQQCHGTDPVAGDTAHISVVTTLADKATALQDEANIVWTHASAVTDYTFEDRTTPATAPPTTGWGATPAAARRRGGRDAARLGREPSLSTTAPTATPTTPRRRPTRSRAFTASSRASPARPTTRRCRGAGARRATTRRRRPTRTGRSAATGRWRGTARTWAWGPSTPPAGRTTRARARARARGATAARPRRRTTATTGRTSGTPPRTTTPRTPPPAAAATVTGRRVGTPASSTARRSAPSPCTGAG